MLNPIAWHDYPDTNFHELNLDWVIAKLKEVVSTLNNFITLNTITFSDPLEWNITESYTVNKIVIDNNGNAYLSKQAVPSGIDINNTDYWLEIFNFTEYVTRSNKNFTVNFEYNTSKASTNYVIGDWLIWEEVLYKVTANIAEGQSFVIDTNIEHFTIEQFLADFITTVNRTILQYKNDIDASESTYRVRLASDIASATASLQAQLDTAISGVTVDSEVINARIGADGVTYATLGGAVRTQFTNVDSEIKGLESNFTINYFNKNDVTLGKYMHYDDATVSNLAAWFYSGFIPVDPNVPTYGRIIPSGTFELRSCQVCYFREADVTTYITGQVSVYEGTAWTIPSNAKYMVISGNQNILNTLCVYHNDQINRYIGYHESQTKKIYDILDATTPSQIITVGASGCDYTSVFEASEYVRTNNLHNIEIRIKAGTYDLLQEMDALYGAGFVENYSSSDSVLGLYLGNGIKIVGDNEGAVEIQCEYTGVNTRIQEVFSVFHVVNTDFTLENIKVIGSRIRYLVHDDCRVAYGKETGIIKNCTFVNNGTTYASSIGGGTWNDDVRLIKDCIFLMGAGVDKYAVSYHPYTGSLKCVVKIDNIYSPDATVVITPAGAATEYTDVYVSNSKLSVAPFNTNPSAPAAAQMIRLHTWNIDI